MARRGVQGAMIRTMKVREHVATVISKEVITPSFMRVHLKSESFFDDAEHAPTAWLRGWFPDHTGKDFEHQRGYTLSSANPDSGDFSLDFVLHEPTGPASAWAQTCAPGDTLSVNTLGSSKFELPEDRPAGYLLIGDSAAIPGLASIVAALPQDIPVELYLEEHHSDDRLIPFPEHARLRTHWVPRTGPDSLAKALESRDWSNWHVWATPESASLKQVRARLRDDFGFPKITVHAQAYWVEGRAMGKERQGQESLHTKTVQPDAVRPDAAGREGVRPETVPQALPSSTAHEGASDTSRVTGEQTGHSAQTSGRRGTWRAAAGSRLLKPLKPVMIATGVLQAIVTLVELAPFVLLVELSRRLLSNAPTGELWALGIWAVALIAIGACLGSALLLWLHVVDAKFERDLRRDLLGKLARLPLGWFDKRNSSQVKQVVQDDTLALHYLVTHAVADAVAAVVAPLAVLIYLFIVDWRLASLLLIPVLVYAVTMYLMLLRSYDTSPKALKWAERMGTEAEAYLEGQPVVRVFGGSARSAFRARLGEYIDFLDAWQRPFSGLKTFMDLATRPTTFLLLIVVFGTLWVSGGSTSPITLLPFLLLGTTFGARLLGIGYGLSGLREGMLAAARVQVLLEEDALDAAASPRLDAAIESATAEGLVEFDRVAFGYRSGTTALQHVSLRLEPGTITALVGPSGAGKSTLAALLARFYDVAEGAIRIDGVDVRSMSADELYSKVGFVFQDTQLVQGTIRENIALARPDASLDEVERAARAAQMHERILQLPHAYDTEVGPHAALSGGEKQRITIARAILADTPVLVLDEATAFADPESEFFVQQAIARLTEGRTVLMIAHRLHTITDVDRIVVLERGEVVQAGRHDELLAVRGKYRELWEATEIGSTVPAGEKDVK